MRQNAVGRVLWKAGEDSHFRRRFLANMGTALAEEGFLLNDEEMQTLRELWETFGRLEDRPAQERILAIARARYRR